MVHTSLFHVDVSQKLAQYIFTALGSVIKKKGEFLNCSLKWKLGRAVIGFLSIDKSEILLHAVYNNRV